MIYQLLTETPTQPAQSNNPTMLIFGIAMIVLLAVWMFFTSRKNKRAQQEYMDKLNAVKPGDKVKSAGGICGYVVEVCDDNTIILETGSEASGKSYIKLDKNSIYEVQAATVEPVVEEKAEEVPVAEEAPAEVAEAIEAPVAEEAPVEAEEKKD